MKRREFLRVAAVGTMGVLVGGAEEEGVRFEEPFDGAVVHERSGGMVMGVVGEGGEKRLRVRFRGTAAGEVEVVEAGGPGKKIAVGREGNKFFGEVLLRDAKTELVARVGKREARTRVVWVKDSYPRYRFQVDDNSFFLRDIHRKNYRSIFESPYLGRFREFRKKYGVKVVLNLFHSTPEEDFNLSQLSDRYKGEWQDNADWLKLAFHARNEFPNHPYLVRTVQQLGEDIDLIEGEIKRFAGEKVYARTALLHWGSIRAGALELLIKRGWRTLSGSGWPLRGAMREYMDKYQVPKHALAYLDQQDAWYNFENGLLFSKIDLCCNRVPLKETLGTLMRAYENPNTREVMDLGTHEQYFWPFYKNYMADHWERLECAFRFVTERGYKAIFPEEDVFERVRERVGG